MTLAQAFRPSTFSPSLVQGLRIPHLPRNSNVHANLRIEGGGGRSGALALLALLMVRMSSLAVWNLWLLCCQRCLPWHHGGGRSRCLGQVATTSLSRALSLWSLARRTSLFFPCRFLSQPQLTARRVTQGSSTASTWTRCRSSRRDGYTREVSKRRGAKRRDSLVWGIGCEHLDLGVSLCGAPDGSLAAYQMGRGCHPVQSPRRRRRRRRRPFLVAALQLHQRSVWSFSCSNVTPC